MFSKGFFLQCVKIRVYGEMVKEHHNPNPYSWGPENFQPNDYNFIKPMPIFTTGIKCEKKKN